MQNLLGNEWRKSQRLKRGGGLPLVHLDSLEAEERYRIEPTDVASADKLFERRWALTLLEATLHRLEQEQTGQARERFPALRPFLIGEFVDQSYASLAQRYGVSDNTVKSWVHRLRTSYRDILRETVAQTVADPGEVQDELRFLARVLSATIGN